MAPWGNKIKEKSEGYYGVKVKGVPECVSARQTLPKSSALNSPLMSDPICVHDEPLSSYTFAAPGGSEEVDDRDFRGIPTATRLPSDDNETELPNSSNL